MMNTRCDILLNVFLKIINLISSTIHNEYVLIAIIFMKSIKSIKKTFAYDRDREGRETVEEIVRHLLTIMNMITHCLSLYKDNPNTQNH